MPVKIRRTYKGAAVSAVLDSSGVASASTTSMSLTTSPSTWPTGKFFVVVAPGTAKEEKMCVTLSGSTLTVVDPAVTSTSASVNGRGVDNTTAQSGIPGGSTVYPVFTAVDADEANELTSTYSAQGHMVYQGASTFTGLGIGTASQVLRVNSGATAPEWGQVATAGIADSAVTTAKIADSAVTTGKIADGTIVNADVSASAAIALSKLATGALPSAITVASANIVDGTIVLADLASALQELLVPSGSVTAYGGTSAPTGWLLCYGQAISRSTYAGLFTAIGTTYGVGDGSTTFNLPDLRGRVIAGQDDMGGSSANRLIESAYHSVAGGTLGSAGGSELHKLVTGEIPSHSHSVTIQGGGSTTTTISAGAGTSGSGSYGTSSTGGSGFHNNVQPTLILNYIIKI